MSLRCSVSGLLFTATLASASAFASPTYKDIAEIVSTSCLSCHSAETAYGDVILDSEANLQKLSKEVLASLSTGAMPLGDEGLKDRAEGKLLISYLESLQAPRANVTTYSDVASILEDNCVACHGAKKAKKGIRLDSQEDALQHAARSYRELVSGSMPPKDDQFAATKEGKLLLNWLKNPKADP